jgi:ribosomal protein S18 acetylase RimI-like enzyme
MELVRIRNGNDVIAIHKALVKNRSGFAPNWWAILERYRDGGLFGLVDGADTRQLESFCTPGLLPCFATCPEEGVIDMIWVHSRLRRRGLGSTLVRLLGAKRALDPVAGSEAFWRACEARHGCRCD